MTTAALDLARHIAAEIERFVLAEHMGKGEARELEASGPEAIREACKQSLNTERQRINCRAMT